MTTLALAVVALVAILVAAWALVSRAGLAGKLAVAAESAGRLAALEARAETAERAGADIREKLAGAEAGSQALVKQLEAAAQANRDRDAELGNLRDKHALVTNELAQTRETLLQERRQHAERVADLQRMDERSKAEFQQLAAGILAKQSETFTKQNNDQVEALLKPLREQIATFEKGLTEARVETARERGTLAEQIKALMTTNDTMRSETRGLAEALRGQSQTQGAWGEMILATILERSGLREGEEYTSQESTTDADGRRLRADVVVNLPGGEGRRIVIDSKVSLTAFDQYVNAADDVARETARRAHLASLRGHVTTLGAKAYHGAIGGGLDYVVLFVPIEGALALALQADPALTGFATDNNVAIATPTTLMMALRTVRSVWAVERRNQNADQIAESAGRLYDKLAGFVDDFQKIGSQMDTAKRTYDGALGKLAQGRGNVLRQAEQLKELGAKANKALPPALLGDEN